MRITVYRFPGRVAWNLSQGAQMNCSAEFSETLGLGPGGKHESRLDTTVLGETRTGESICTDFLHTIDSKQLYTPKLIPFPCTGRRHCYTRIKRRVSGCSVLRRPGVGLPGAPLSCTHVALFCDLSEYLGGVVPYLASYVLQSATEKTWTLDSKLGFGNHCARTSCRANLETFESRRTNFRGKARIWEALCTDVL